MHETSTNINCQTGLTSSDVDVCPAFVTYKLLTSSQLFSNNSLAKNIVQKSWIINSLLEDLVCSIVGYFHSSLVF